MLKVQIKWKRQKYDFWQNMCDLQLLQADYVAWKCSFAHSSKHGWTQLKYLCENWMVGKWIAVFVYIKLY